MVATKSAVRAERGKLHTWKPNCWTVSVIGDCSLQTFFFRLLVQPPTVNFFFFLFLNYKQVVACNKKWKKKQLKIFQKYK